MSRIDGRAPDALRPLRLTSDYLTYADGSVLIELGETKVICAASIEETVPPFLRDKGRGWLTAEYRMLPRSTQSRSPREGGHNPISGRTQEIQRLIGRSLRSTLDFVALGERTIIIDCDVIGADGGTRTAAITGGYLALALAVKRLIDNDLIERSPLFTSVAAVSAGRVGDELLLDLCYVEDSKADVDANVVMTAAGDLVELGATAEKGAYSRAELNALLDLSEKGIAELRQAQEQFLGRM